MKDVEERRMLDKVRVEEKTNKTGDVKRED